MEIFFAKKCFDATSLEICHWKERNEEREYFWMDQVILINLKVKMKITRFYQIQDDGEYSLQR